MSDKVLTQIPYSTSFKHLSDLKSWVGKEIGLTDWLIIDQESTNTFAKLTDDEQWIHVDPEKAKIHSPYKTTVVHGYMILAFISKFTYACISIEDVEMVLNYGLDKVRFPSATLVGASIRGRVSLIAFEGDSKSAKYKMKMVFEQKEETKPACVAEFIVMAYT